MKCSITKINRCTYSYSCAVLIIHYDGIGNHVYEATCKPLWLNLTLRTKHRIILALWYHIIPINELRICSRFNQGWHLQFEKLCRVQTTLSHKQQCTVHVSTMQNHLQYSIAPIRWWHLTYSWVTTKKLTYNFRNSQ